jgi:hypothetical protein
LEFFRDEGIKVFNADDLKYPIDFREGVYPISWLDEIITKDGKETPRPALVQVSDPFNNDNPSYSLFVDKFCPFHSEYSKCAIYDKKERPYICKRYPVFGKRTDYEIRRSCAPFNQREIREDFRRKFLKNH